MNNYGLDTSVVVRLLIKEPVEQAEIAQQFILDARTQGCTIWVSDLVLAEAYYVLHSYYDTPKDVALSALLQLIDSGDVDVEPDGCGRIALQDKLSNPGKLGWVDRMIYEQYRRKNARLVSFEKAAGPLSKAMRLG